MDRTVENKNYFKNLERITQVRVEVANCLEQMAETIELAELEGKISSGELGLNSQLEDMKVVEGNLRQGGFQLLLLGNMQRKNGTFLNTAIGENLLSDINSCTAILTILRYGQEKKVTVYFNNEKEPQQLEFKEFKQAYVIDSSKAKQLEQDRQKAFPDISHAVVEYPLPLLEKGIEIIDNPGLNGLEARNEISLSYINKSRGVSIFLSLDAWNRIREESSGSEAEEELPERAIAQLRQARTIARQAYIRTQEAIQRRIPLLEQNIDQLNRKINLVEPKFKKLTDIRDRFQKEIRNSRDAQAKEIADSFRNYILHLGNTFEVDFLSDRANLKLFDLLSENKRDTFNAALQKAFMQYVNDKLSHWTLTAEKDLNTAFTKLTVSAAQYGTFYSQVTDEITEKIIEQKIIVHSHSTAEDVNTPAWTKWAMGLFSLASGDLAEIAVVDADFEWKNILFNYVAVISIGSIISAITGILLKPLGLALVGLSMDFVPAERARQELAKIVKKELVKHLPQVASEQWLTVYNSVKECFDVYEREIARRIDDDIASRRSELGNLVKQKETFEINHDSELQRLQKLDGEVLAKLNRVENLFRSLSASM